MMLSILVQLIHQDETMVFIIMCLLLNGINQMQLSGKAICFWIVVRDVGNGEKEYLSSELHRTLSPGPFGMCECWCKLCMVHFIVPTSIYYTWKVQMGILVLASEGSL